jgi:hypothetical protein
VEHIFVEVTKALAWKRDKTIWAVSSNVVELQVSCYDHQTLLGMMFVSWYTTRNYLTGPTDGY